MSGLQTAMERLGIQDLDEILRIEKASFSMPWTEAHFRGPLRGKEGTGTVAGVKEVGRLAGYISWIRVADEVHILNLAVDPPMRRSGLGRAMLRQVLDDETQAGARIATLEVRAGNQGAIRLYASEGFKELALRKNYYTDTGEDAIVMGRMDLGRG